MATQDDNTILSKADLKAYHQKILPFLGGNNMMSTNNSDYYSTDEKIVGVSEDGKPLYQKTIIGNLPTGSTGDNTPIWTNFTSSGCEFQGGDGVLNWTSGRVAVPWAGGENNKACLNIYQGNLVLFWAAAHFAGGAYRINVRYTKTTDAAGSATTTPGAYDLNRPDLWPANKEIFFGDGLYGQRFTGTITSNGAATDLNVTVSSIINEGGQISFPNWVAAPAPFGITASNGNSAWGMIFKANSNSNLNINAWYFEGSTTVAYDVWVTYKK